MRVSSQLAGCLEPWLMEHRHPYGLEVVNDPYDVFAPGCLNTGSARSSAGGSPGNWSVNVAGLPAWPT